MNVFILSQLADLAVSVSIGLPESMKGEECVWNKRLFLTQASWMTATVSIETSGRIMGLSVCVFLCMLLLSFGGFWRLLSVHTSLCLIVYIVWSVAYNLKEGHWNFPGNGKCFLQEHFWFLLISTYIVESRKEYEAAPLGAVSSTGPLAHCVAG